MLQLPNASRVMVLSEAVVAVDTLRDEGAPATVAWDNNNNNNNNNTTTAYNNRGCQRDCQQQRSRNTTFRTQTMPPASGVRCCSMRQLFVFAGNAPIRKDRPATYAQSLRTTRAHQSPRTLWSARNGVCTPNHPLPTTTYLHVD